MIAKCYFCGTGTYLTKVKPYDVNCESGPDRLLCKKCKSKALRHVNKRWEEVLREEILSIWEALKNEN